MPSFINLTNKRFGKLTVIKRAVNDGKLIAWHCLCDCGNKKITRSENLSKGKVKSCGCWKIEVNKTKNLSHGHCKRNLVTKTYQTWAGMFRRCYDATRPDWIYYGAKGVKVCDRWFEFSNFLEDMGEVPKGLQIDRFPDTNGNYEPENCRWATPKQQRNNQRPRTYKHPRYKNMIKAKEKAESESEENGE